MKILKSGTFVRLWRLTDSERRGKLELVTMQNDKGSYGIIENVFVEEEHRGQGIASQLIAEAINLAKEKNFYKITLTCSEDMVYFYARHGFSWHMLGQSHCMRINLK